MEVKVYDGNWAKYQPLWEVEVETDGEGEFLGIV